MLGLSLYPHHLPDGSATTLEAFCEMAAAAAEIVGVEHLGIGSDLCQDQPDAVLAGCARAAGRGPIPPTGRLFRRSPAGSRIPRLFPISRTVSRAAGFAEADMEGVLGANWQRFFRAAFRPALHRPQEAGDR